VSALAWVVVGWFVVSAIIMGVAIVRAPRRDDWE
jgi:hypothetical protein